VLVEIAKRLSSAANSDALVARLGGDEFGVVTWLGCEEIALGRLARNIELAFKEPYLVGGSKCYLSASIGTALYPVDGETVEHLVRSADGRMYGLKRARKSRHEKWMA
jgi:diguanylate cyclase (GGDEF)-like protein